MCRERIYIVLIVSILLLSMGSCRTSRTAVTSYIPGEAGASSYIERYKDLAISEMKRTGVPASITLAQGMVESDYGRSTLATKANNHFGIKCHNDWTGPLIRHHDDKRNECFRKYDRPEDSFYDHSDFLVSGSRYRSLFDLKITDYKGWAHGLKKAGYATNPDYANMLIRKIEEYSLYVFDSDSYASDRGNNKSGHSETEAVNSGSPVDSGKVSSDTENISVVATESRIMENNRIRYIIVKDGETKETLEKKFQLLRWELARYNELERDFVPVPGQILYLQPKRDKAEPGKVTHTVSEGETIYFISQKYGIKIDKLYEMNRMEKGLEPAAGEKVWLRDIKPVN